LAAFDRNVRQGAHQDAENITKGFRSFDFAARATSANTNARGRSPFGASTISSSGGGSRLQERRSDSAKRRTAT
jgi:hypothetical protein